MKLTFFRKTASLLLAGILTLGMCSCSAAGAGAGTGKLKVVTTIFPEYDWVREIAGDRLAGIDLTMLLDNGIDMHSFQPTAQDIIKISTCDVFVYVGGESDGWVEDALKEAVNKNMQVVNLLDLLGESVVEEELIEGMQAEEACEAEDEEEPEYDEHVWLSLRNAQVLVTGIADALGKADPANADTYKANAEAYNSKLSGLDDRYREAVAGGTKDTVLFGDRFPFRYLTDDYGLKYYAAFAGCSAETEASFETVVFLSGKLDELGLKTVLVIENADQSIARTVIDNTAAKDQEILVMDSMQTTTSADSAKGVTYESVMEKNLEVLKKALG
jgi:zinc transport system substrate-binding protein